MELRFPLPRHFQCGDLKVIKEVIRLRLEGLSILLRSNPNNTGKILHLEQLAPLDVEEQLYSELLLGGLVLC